MRSVSESNILQKIVAVKHRELAALKQRIPPGVVSELADRTVKPRLSMKEAIIAGSGIIAEFKRRSPSKGEIAPMANVTETARLYSATGVSAMSVLTDVSFFGGSEMDLVQARVEAPALPIIRKEFIIDKYQIDWAKILGASSILLIAAILSVEEVRVLTNHAHSIGLEVLLEFHNSVEIKRFTAIDADMVGINNRDLTTFSTDCNVSEKLFEILPYDKVRIAESGIKTPEDMDRLRKIGFDGFLIGEALMSSPDPVSTLKAFTYGNR